MTIKVDTTHERVKSFDFFFTVINTNVELIGNDFSENISGPARICDLRGSDNFLRLELESVNAVVLFKPVITGLHYGAKSTTDDLSHFSPCGLVPQRRTGQHGCLFVS